MIVLSEFQKQKLQYIFKMIDSDKNNLICLNDHLNHTLEYVNILYLKISEHDVEKRDSLKKKFSLLSSGFWGKVMESLGFDKPTPITEKEFLNAFATMLTNSCFLSQYLWTYLEEIWLCLGLDHSHPINYDDVICFISCDKNQERRKFFDILDTEKKGGLYIYELYHYWFNYFYSNNHSCSSKYVFGEYNY